MNKNSDEDIRKFSEKVKDFYLDSKDTQFPWRDRSATPYEVLIAEIFLQRTGRKQAERVYQKFISLFPGPESLSKTDYEEILKIMKPLGLHWRAKKIKKLGEVLKKKYEKKVPSDEEIFNLPGAGKYVGNMVLCLAFGKRRAPVDSNVGRILNRVFGMNKDGRLSRDRDILRLANKCLPKKEYRKYNLALVDLGNQICKPKSPECGICPFKNNCRYNKS